LPERPESPQPGASATSAQLPEASETNARFSTRQRFPTLGPPRAIFAVFLCGLFAFLDLYATQPLLPLLAHLYHASKAQVGLTVSASTLGVAIAAPLLGIFAERISRRRVIIVSMFALVVPTVLAATSQSLHMLVMWRFLQGLIIPGIFAITITYITEEWGVDSVALVMSLYVSGTALGGFLGRMVTGLIAAHFAWQYSFAAAGGLTLLGALAVSRWLPAERPRSVHPSALSHGFLSHLRNPKVLVTCWAGFNVLFSLVAVFTYVTFYLVAPPFGLSIQALSYLFVVYLVGLLVTPGAGFLLQRVGLRVGMVGANLLSFTGVLFTLVQSLPVVVVGLALACTGVFISQACATSFLREAAPTGGRAAAIGLYVCCYYIGGTVGGVVPSYAWKLGGWPACVLLIGAVQWLTIGVALVGWREREVVVSV
jgi:YNFM family putative membrane transporter